MVLRTISRHASKAAGLSVAVPRHCHSRPRRQLVLGSKMRDVEGLRHRAFREVSKLLRCVEAHLFSDHVRERVSNVSHLLLGVGQLRPRPGDLAVMLEMKPNMVPVGLLDKALLAQRRAKLVAVYWQAATLSLSKILDEKRAQPGAFTDHIVLGQGRIVVEQFYDLRLEVR